jgi:hypothetical protein
MSAKADFIKASVIALGPQCGPTPPSLLDVIKGFVGYKG